MKRKNAMFLNNNCEWLKIWYGISAVSDRYSGYDVVEANGRVFVKASLSTIIGNGAGSVAELTDATTGIDEKILKATPDDLFIGFVKPTSMKVTILDVISAKETGFAEYPTISCNGDEVTWIDRTDSRGDTLFVTIKSASVKYTENYRISESDISVEQSVLAGRRPQMFLKPYSVQNDDPLSSYLFAADPDADRRGNVILASDPDGKFSELCTYDRLYGYNEDMIFLGSIEDGIILIDRSNNKITTMNEFPGYGIDDLAYVDAARNEFCFYEEPGCSHPGKCALIGLAYSSFEENAPVTRERFSCPDVVSNFENPLIFDGYKYVWRMNDLWKGYRVFRKDASLRDQFIVDESDERAASSVVFTSPTVIFTEWDGSLSYSTNKGLCQMFRLDAKSSGKKLKISKPDGV